MVTSENGGGRSRPTPTTATEEAPSPTRRYTGTLVAHTHWDRAWYLPFEQFRIRLVRLIDRLLEILERDPEFRCFMLDGQMVVVEDYLEVRPEQRADVERLAREGRLLVGPWYVLPDEFLVSPEALIRNLELGMRLAEEFGGAMRIGYEPDAFGHVGQLPQILAGFGIDNAVVWRGMGEEARQLGSEFWWVAPDGTRSLAIFLPTAYDPFRSLGYPYPGAPTTMPFRVEWAIDKLERRIAELIPFANTPCLLLLSGSDHEEANPHLPEAVREASRRLPDVAIRMGSLPAHIDCVRAWSADLPEYRGELRSGAMAYVLQQVYSARMHLKQRNTWCQTLLERYAEPLTAFAGLLAGIRRGQTRGDTRERVPETAFLELAWRALLKNHPHDDICGCSVDPVHRQMEARFDQVDQIGEALVRDALRFLTDHITVPDDTGMPLFVFNPSGQSYEGTTTASLSFSPDQEAFSIRDEEGNLIPHQELGRRTRLDMEVNRPRRTQYVDVALVLPQIPACGYRTLFIGPPSPPSPSGPLSRDAGEGEPDKSVSPSPEFRERGPGGEGASLENEHLRVTLHSDGTIDLLDRQTGARFEGLHGIEDIEDAGDEYTYSPAAEGRTLTNADARVELELLSDGPIRAGYRIRYRLALPRQLTQDRRSRSEETVDYLVTTEVWLGVGTRQLDFVTRVTNTARDHRLRVVFPTSIQTDTVHVDGHFDVVERPVALPEGRGWSEPPSPTAHQRAFVDVSDGTVGLAVFNRGLPEYESRPGRRGVEIALTLLRCVGWLSRGDLATRPGGAGPQLEAPEAQCLRDYEFRYAIQSHAGTWEAIAHDAHAFNAPCMVVTDRTTEGLLPSDVGIPPRSAWEPILRGKELDILPSSGSFVRLSPEELVLSAVRSAGERSLTVRCYNPTSRGVRGRLQLLWPIRSASLVNFLGEVQEELPVEDDIVSFDAPPKRVISILSTIL